MINTKIDPCSSTQGSIHIQGHPILISSTKNEHITEGKQFICGSLPREIVLDSCSGVLCVLHP